ncbi:hypothetical protein H696_00773 [Fonticula alba]|uniref:Septin-type G domain-containing protein n=1 Tax=Fonticula alba TaxID=691883 RepID=A0A058ZI81_FONAL|nr:hypothetical protein H696_00773 [Fonticula alba]KCV73232.1 hypothetical protein H696_00773 [Fonticula alba]|eukprot:XP_009492933.1 hypothetical protein H696_00773 [Fonticula alba]
MIVGSAGLGKTTLVQAMTEGHDLSGPSHPIDLPSTVAVSARSMVLDISGALTQLSIIDTPGFGAGLDRRDHFEAVVNYVEQQQLRYLIEESRVDRSLNVIDTRVHVAVYMIPPTGTANVTEKLPGHKEPVLVRKYPWGTINVEDPEICDYTLLASCLLDNSTHIEFFTERSRLIHYESFRREVLSSAADGGHLDTAAIEALLDQNLQLENARANQSDAASKHHIGSLLSAMSAFGEEEEPPVVKKTRTPEELMERALRREELSRRGSSSQQSPQLTDSTEAPSLVTADSVTSFAESADVAV